MTSPSQARRRIVLINGHPDPRPERYCTALATAYAEAAATAGHTVTRIDVAACDLPLLRSRDAFVSEPDAAVRTLQSQIASADHIVLIYPLWLGGPPAMLKAWLEQVFRYGFALAAPGSAKGVKGLLAGRSARIVVTMGMPSAIFRLVFFAHGLKAVSRGILWISGVSPIRETVIGNVEGGSLAHRVGWLTRIKALGQAGR